MKITIDISEEEILNRAKEIAANALAAEIKKTWCIRDIRLAAKEVIRQEIRANMDTYSETAIQAAAKSIENKVGKNLLEKMLNGGES